MKEVQTYTFLDPGSNVSFGTHNKLKRYARYAYYRDLLEQHRSDIRKTWNIMNSVIYRTRNKSSIPDTFMINNKRESNKEIIADSFCQYFTNIGKQFADAITPSKHSFESYLKSERNPHSMFLDPTDPSEISKIIKSFKMEKSTDHLPPANNYLPPAK